VATRVALGSVAMPCQKAKRTRRLHTKKGGPLTRARTRGCLNSGRRDSNAIIARCAIIYPENATMRQYASCRNGSYHSLPFASKAFAAAIWACRPCRGSHPCGRRAPGNRECFVRGRVQATKVFSGGFDAARRPVHVGNVPDREHDGFAVHER